MSVLIDLLSDNLRQSVAGADFMNSLSSKKMIVGKPLPNVELIDVNGEKKMISDFVTPGRYTLIELWASWCSPCKAEFPFLKRAYEKYNPKGFDIVSISIDTDENDWKKALEEERMPWPQLLDKERVALRACETSAVPTCILVDPTGKIYALEARGGWLDMILQTIYPN